ncbi:MAG: TRAP transporter small permease [Geminicoccaceae bacterium]|nr:TRAP transporter small permease [Geminicoccaceae bacterium]MCB9942603.1 TRAP transporter small permease [Geminicoccaceae bacterium]
MARVLRTALDALYRLCGAISAFFLLALLVIILLQIFARWTGQQFPGSADYAGYCMAAASFFALAYSLNDGAHIRVSLLLSRFSGQRRRMAEIWCVGVSTFLSCYFAWYAVKAVQVSRKIHDISQGQDATPMWIPQMAMAIGTVVLAIAFIDNLVKLLMGRETVIEDKAIE